MKHMGLIIAILVAVIAAYMVLKFSGKEEPRVVAQPQQPVQVSQRQAPEIKTENVYVASSAIPIGTVIEENMLTVQPWPKHLLLDGFIVGAEEAQKVIGTVTRAPFQKSEPIIRNKIVNPSDPNFLAGELPKGQRIVTMQTDEITGVAGFVFPGDRVDVIVRHKILKEGVSQYDLESSNRVDELYEEVAETLLANIRVLAVDQRASAGVDKRDGIIIPRSISLEVTPENAQRLVLARKIGHLSLALRSIHDKDTMETVAITRQSDLSQFEVSSVSPEREDEEQAVRVIRGTEMQTSRSEKR